ncbi:hypothetical protein BS47DRAFT_77204 [Hydnum rufescens UP504]|uniref:Uncharacterized protein n=1 Tax=Hydnum rufescens UP504 TaxID=1448309 RepID=A0A9P6B861_9AGAM|nr:hypothetical protein BS47DRAFT_77204 [Hydnum rufescens UP504]
MHRILGTVPPTSEESSSSAELRTSPMDDDRPHSSSSGTGEGSPTLVWGEDLLNIFLQYRHRCAFVVHEARFVQKFQRHLQVGAESRDSMHPSLVNAVFLVACHFASASGDTRYEEYEGYFLRKTREELETSLTAADRLTDFVYATTLACVVLFC